MTRTITEILQRVEAGQSKLDNVARSMKGMSGIKVRQLLNVCLDSTDARYLEVGVWHGSTLYSALVGNAPACAVAIDDFSQFGGTLETFQKNTATVADKFVFVDADCFSVDVTSLACERFNVFFYDGNHSADAHSKALTHFYSCLANEFLFICDDWNWNHVRAGTFAGIKACNLTVVEARTMTAPRNMKRDQQGWWNGVWIARLSKR